MVAVTLVAGTMGCTGSVVYPDDRNHKLKQANGVKISVKNGNSNHLTGDYSQLQLAKHNRDKYVKQRQSKVFTAAHEMSGRIMEEREMLSLGTRSRGTSRDTSRAASPTSAKKTLAVKDEKPGPMTPVAEDLHSRDSRRIEKINHDEDDEELVLLHKKSKTKSTHKVKKKHKTHRASKPKDKSKKHKKVKKSKAGKDGKEALLEVENVDSGLEDNLVENSDEERDNVVSRDNDVIGARRNSGELTTETDVGVETVAGEEKDQKKGTGDDSDNTGNNLASDSGNTAADSDKAAADREVVDNTDNKPEVADSDISEEAKMEENKI